MAEPSDEIGTLGERCWRCEGTGCEEGCGLRGGCEFAYAGPDSHRICLACHGVGRTFRREASDGR